MGRGWMIVLSSAVVAALPAAWLLGEGPAPPAPEHEGATLEPEGIAPGLALGAGREPSQAPSSVPIDPDALLRDLQGDSSTRRAAWNRIHRDGAPAYHEGLARFFLGWLTSGDPVLAGRARFVLVSMGPEVATLLEPLYGASSAAVRRVALDLVYHLRINGHPYAGDPPLQTLAQDADRDVREWTLRLLTRGVRYDPALAGWLVTRVEPDNGISWRGPEIALARMGSEGIEHLLGLLEQPGERYVLNVLFGLGHAGPPALKKILPRLDPYLRAQDETVAVAAIQVLTILEGDCLDSLPALTDALQNESVLVVDAALQVFEAMGARAVGASGAVLKLLDSGNDRIVTRAAGVLAMFRAEPARALPALARTAHEEVNDAAARALAAYGPDALAHALAAYDAADDDGRYALLLTLQELGPAAASATPRLIALLAGDDYLLQTRALEALAAIGPAAAAAVPAIVARIGTTDDGIPVDHAVGALARLGPRGKSAVSALLASRDARVRAGAVKTVMWHYGRTAYALDALAALAKDPSWLVRQQALQGIFVAANLPGQPRPNPDVAPVLLARIRRLLEAGLEDRDERVREYARKALGALPE